MDTEQFAITEQGQVHRLGNHDHPVLLGHISCLAREESPLGREVRAWWQARLASDEPAKDIEVTGNGEFRFVPGAGTVAVIGPRPEPRNESVESGIAAD